MFIGVLMVIDERLLPAFCRQPEQYLSADSGHSRKTLTVEIGQ